MYFKVAKFVSECEKSKSYERKHIPASNMSKRSVCLFYIHFLLVLFYGIKKKNEKEENFLSLLIFFFIFDIIKTYFQVPH